MVDRNKQYAVTITTWQACGMIGHKKEIAQWVHHEIWLQ